MNYIKLMGATHSAGFFPFTTPDERRTAIDAARSVQPEGCLVVWQPLPDMPPGLRCVGHAPREDDPMRPGPWTCLNCGQKGTK